MQAQQALVKAQRPGADTDLGQQQAVVDGLLAQLQAKQAPYTDVDLQAAVAAVAQAEAQVALAQANLDQTTVVAPFDGVVSQRLLTAGALASASAPIVVLTSNAVEVHVTVEEAREPWGGEDVVGLLVGAFVPVIGALAAAGLLMLLGGAIVAHLRNGDGLREIAPAVVLGLVTLSFLLLVVGDLR